TTLAAAQREQNRVQSEMNQANAKLGSLETINRDDSADLSQIPVSGGAVEPLRRQLSSAQSKMAALRQTYLDQHPKVVALQAEIDGLQNDLRRELDRAAQARRAERAQLASRAASLRMTLAEKENEIRAAEEQLGQAEQTERVAVRVARTVGPVRVETGTVQPVIPRIAVVDPADVAPNPVRPRKALNLAVCLAAGLLVGLALNLLRDAPRHTIRTPEDFETEFELPVLGVMPRKPSASVA
ncbi:MAG TPA: GNVR domain-containing protein, partial [Candidatus Eisenbacteria bacterium]|nr:GNVR domain-containing protein [Candidatus Eisenbacteria bacterium]